jgi:hypothetical protein
MLDDGGIEMPRTVSEKGSLYPPGIPSINCLSSWDEIEPSLIRVTCLPVADPTLVCFLLSTFERGLSIVEAEEPEASEGVRMLGGTSSFGNREVDVCCEGFEFAILGC